MKGQLKGLRRFGRRPDSKREPQTGLGSPLGHTSRNSSNSFRSENTKEHPLRHSPPSDARRSRDSSEENHDRASESGPQNALLGSPPHRPHTELAIPDFWNEAYENIRADEAHKDLLANYSSLLGRMSLVSTETNASVGGGRGEDGDDDIIQDNNTIQPTNDILGDKDVMRKVVQYNLEEMQTKEWLVRWKGKEVFKVRKQVEGIVNIVKTFSGLIGQVTSLNAHAGIAWAGVCVILPLVMNDTDERGKAISGVEKVAGIVARYTQVEMQYRQKRHDLNREFEKSLIEVYRKISLFYMKAAYYFSRSTSTRTARNMVKLDDWETVLSDIDESDKNCSRFAHILSFRDILQETHEILARVKRSESQELMRRIKEWLLRDVRPDGRKQKLKPLYLNSGKWLLDSETYTLWKENGQGQLWIHGPAGTGKTSLISVINEQFRKQDQLVAYFYCTGTSLPDRQQSEVAIILRALIAQLALSPIDADTVAEEVQLSYKRAATKWHHEMPEPLEDETAQHLLTELIKSREQVTLIVDALDECREPKRLLKVLRDIVDQSKNLRLLLSSQYVVSVDDVAFFPSIKKAVAGGPDSIDDMKFFIKHEVHQFGQTHDGMVGGELANEMVDILARKAGGMFKWTQLCLDFVLNAESDNASDVQSNWDTLKNEEFAGVMADVIKLHDKLFEKELPSLQHSATRKSKEDAAWRTLQWVSGAIRPLNNAEYFALQAAPEGSGLSSQHNTVTNISKICRTLINTSEDGTVVISHSTVRDYVSLKSAKRIGEYLEQARVGNASLQSRILSESRKAFNEKATSFVASECLGLLNSSSHDQPTKDELSAYVPKSSPLLKYAAKEWVHQIRACMGDGENIPAEMVDMMRTFFHPIDGRASFRKWLTIWDPDTQRACQPLGTSSLYYAVLLDFPEIVHFLLNDGFGDPNSDGGGMGSPFQLACYRDQRQIIDFFLKNETDVNVVDDIMGTPLQAAIAGGHAELVQRLLADCGADPNVQAGLFGNALQLTLALEDKAALGALIAHGVRYDRGRGKPSAKAWAAVTATSKSSLYHHIEEMGRHAYPRMSQVTKGDNFPGQLKVLALCVALTTQHPTKDDNQLEQLVSASQRRTHHVDLNHDGFLPERIIQLVAGFVFVHPMAKWRSQRGSDSYTLRTEILDTLEHHQEFLEHFPRSILPAHLEEMLFQMFTKAFEILPDYYHESQSRIQRKKILSQASLRALEETSKENLNAFKSLHEKLKDAEKDAKLALQIEQALTGPRDDILAVLRDMAAEMADLRKEVRDLAFAVRRSPGD